jgi:hypothetical protein
MKVTFRGASSCHVLIFSGSDNIVWQVFSPSETGLPHYRFLELLGYCYEREQIYSREELLQAAREFEAVLERERVRFPYHYSYEMGIGELHSKGSGGVGGFHIDGKTHSIWGGAGVCYLKEMGIGPDGRGYDVKKIDIREKKRIETDDFGTIKVFRRKLKLSIFESIQALISFLSICEDKLLRVTGVEKEPSLMDIVRSAWEGGGADDFADEELLKMGDKAKAGLIAKLEDRKAKKYYESIAQLLLTVFPSAESRQAVERALLRETDEARRGSMALWLGMTQTG